MKFLVSEIQAGKGHKMFPLIYSLNSKPILFTSTLVSTYKIHISQGKIDFLMGVTDSCLPGYVKIQEPL